MKRFTAFLAAALVSGLVGNRSFAQTTVTVDPAAPWQTWMNVSEVYDNAPGGYLWGSGWGITDLVALFGSNDLTLAPNSVNDVSDYWYLPSGGPGATGNKWMEGNVYVETSALVGQTVTFQGVINANTLVDPYSAVAFIKDFDAGYSLFNTITVPLTPGPFSISLDTFDDPTHHIQYGFALSGPTVWITDAPAKGTVKVALDLPADPADFNNDGFVNGLDLAAWEAAFTAGNGNADADDNGLSDGADLLIWQRRSVVTGGGVSAIPEPASALLAAVGLALVGRRRARSRS